MKQTWLITLILILPTLNRADIEMPWISKDQHPGKVKEILVLSVAGKADSAAAVYMEKKLVSELRSFNYAAESAIEHFGKNAFVKIREEETIKQLYPYDAAIIISLVNESQQRGRKPSECDDFFWEYYDSMYSAAHAPHARNAGKYFWEASFFVISSWNLSYRMKTPTFPYSLATARIPGNGNLIIRDMLAKHIIQPMPEKLKAF